MDDPVSYVRYRKLQYRDNIRFLTENIGRIRWRGESGLALDGNGGPALGVGKADQALGVDSEHKFDVDNKHGTPDVVNGESASKIDGKRGLDRDRESTLDKLDVGNGDAAAGVSKTEPVEVSRIERVLDIGSGDGEFTATVLRRALPRCHLIGFDKSAAMVAHARTHHARTGVTFERVEIGKPIPEHYMGTFDHIFSFFCYHWIPNPKLAFSQTYELLAAGGDCLLLMVAHFPIVYDVYRWFSRSARWSRWVRDLDDLMSPYDCEDPEMRLRKFAEDAGFKDVHVKNNRYTYTYAAERDVKDMMTSLNPFPIPGDLMEEYLEEFVRVSKAEGHLSDTLTISYSTNTLYARKY